MSIEDKLDALTKAVEANTAAILKGGAAPAATAAAKPGKPAAGKKKDEPTLETIKEKFGGYLAGQKGEEKAKRMAQVASINQKFDVERATLLDASDYAEALGYLASYAAGETPDFDGAWTEEDGEAVV